MKFGAEKNKIVPTFVPINILKKLYTKPKIHYYKEEVNGKLKPVIKTGKYWYVYYFFRNPNTGKLQKFTEKQGVNTINNLTERKKYIKNLQKAVLLYLQKGYNPFELYEPNLIHKKEFSIKEAFELAIEEKKKVWGKNSATQNIIFITVFENWLKKQSLLHENINTLTKRHVILFLNSLRVNASTRNTYRRSISSIIGQLVADEIIPFNFISTIPKLKEKPKKNKPFTKDEIKTIKDYLLSNDPYLYTFIKFVMYGFLRPIEVTRIKIKDINLKQNVIRVQSKTENEAAIFITDQLKETILEMNLTNYDANFHIFSANFEPGIWQPKTEKAKTLFFSSRFKKLKRNLNFTDDYGIYSFRHSAAIDLFTNYKKQGLTDLEAKHKMLPITRHKSIDSLNKYLRDIGASLPKDYSKDYTIDF